MIQEEDLEQEWGVGAMAANPDENIPESDETKRLAIVDLDWDKIRAVDILAVLRSFLTNSQGIAGVAVYPSDFGLQKMQEEAAVGPHFKPLQRRLCTLWHHLLSCPFVLCGVDQVQALFAEVSKSGHSFVHDCMPSINPFSSKCISWYSV